MDGKIKKFKNSISIFIYSDFCNSSITLTPWPLTKLSVKAADTRQVRNKVSDTIGGSCSCTEPSRLQAWLK